MNKGILVVIILSLIIVVLLVFLLLATAKNPREDIKFFGIQVTSPRLNDEISSPLKILGSVNGNGWVGFEGQVGTVKLLDGNGKEITMGILTATTEWMTLPINFETTLNFSTPETETGTLVFRNENAPGLPEKDLSFSLPIEFSNNRTIEVGVFLGNLALSASNEQDECKRVYRANRYVGETSGVAKVAIEELLKGPTDAEKLAGFFTSIPNGGKINNISIVDGIARIDFNEVVESGGGSCSMASRVAQIKQTLIQFSTIKSVEISINGRIGDIFQP